MTDNFWTPFDLEKALAEKADTARFEALVRACPLSKADAAELAANVRADRAAQRAAVR
ncbi:hypothetical protein [Microcystis phage Mae-Yong1326-1]|nr:hypothetical protein [Microcystis phage Mae-Yong1326-1]